MTEMFCFATANRLGIHTLVGGGGGGGEGKTVGRGSNGPYAKLSKIIQNYYFKGAGGPMFKTCQCAPFIAVMTISEFEPHSRFHS